MDGCAAAGIGLARGAPGARTGGCTAHDGDWGAESGYRNGLEFDAAAHSAVFVANDQMALGFMRALHERGISVPGDISVVGFDDQPEAAYFLPPLTTVRQDFRGMGRFCIDHLLLEVSGGTSRNASGSGTAAGSGAAEPGPAAAPDPRGAESTPESGLIVRSSTAPPAK